MTAYIYGILPEKISVRFRTRRCTGTPSGTVPAWYVKTVELADIYSDAGAGFSGTKMFHDTALALFASGGTEPTNKTALDALATQIAKDYYQWRFTSFDETFPEIIAPETDGITDLIEWGYEIDRVWTRTTTAPWNDDAVELSHHDPANKDCKDSTGVTVTQTPCITLYGPPGVCASNKPQLTRYKVCLTGGLLIQKFISSDTVS